MSFTMRQLQHDLNELSFLVQSEGNTALATILGPIDSELASIGQLETLAEQKAACLQLSVMLLHMQFEVLYGPHSGEALKLAASTAEHLDRLRFEMAQFACKGM